ncbi:MAG: hypothetical protein AAF355_08200 [Myxococcota bacterium]
MHQTETGEDVLDEAWSRLEQQWNDEKAHESFLGLCVSLDRLAEAGKRYRQVRDTQTDRRAEAEKRMQRLIAITMAQMQASKTPSERAEPSRRRLRVVAFVFAFVLVGLSLLALTQMASH